MSKKQFISKLSSVLADIRKLDAKKIVLDNKDILEYIEENTPTIKHSQDTRDTVTENDLWGQYVETKDDGTIVVHDYWVTNASGSVAWNTTITKVEDNKAYTGEAGDTFFANIQTEKIKNGSYMFKYTPITSFTSDLSSLVYGNSMFENCSNLILFSGDLSSIIDGNSMFCSSTLTSFTSDLSSLVDGKYMFTGCYLTSFSGDLSSLVDGKYMFQYTLITSFTSDLSRLVDGKYMLAGCSNLTSFSGDLISLVDGNNMFYNTPITSFTSDLSSLVAGKYMFNKTSLSPKSVMYIVDSIKNITEEKAKYINGEIPWVTYDSTTKKYSAHFGFMENGAYVYTYNNPQSYTTTISSSYVGNLTLGINVTDDAETIQQQLEDFAKEATFDSWEDLKQAFVNKGWTVTFQYGGTSTTITLPEDE